MLLRAECKSKIGCPAALKLSNLSQDGVKIDDPRPELDPEEETLEDPGVDKP